MSSCVTNNQMLADKAEAPAEQQYPTPPKGKEWVAIREHSDEFNASQLDKTKWQAKHPFWEGRDSYFTPSNVSVADGFLRLKSTLMNSNGEVKKENISSAIIASNNPTYGPGYYEARIKSSDLSMTTAFWFQGKYSEIDVIENIGRPSNEESRGIESTMKINTHYYPDGWDKDIDSPIDVELGLKTREGFHNFGVWWREDNTSWYYFNGVKVAEAKHGGPFNEKMYLYFDTEVFAWHGWPTKESLLDPNKNTVLVDWVRAWQLKNVTK
ncbi:family 16 glycosylhydrolase [Paraglaciecola sp. L3A3]|uniref:family 16 glycosylhydrolase n=1 Tax=Paraglaciecola sp. L3A3 TaxID=2686358 RepID=UPI00131D9C40|nr:family 16 glycosylhydrolase [Paraglaciecola sp. L3A3]